WRPRRQDKKNRLGLARRWRVAQNGLAAALLLLENRNHPAATAIGREREERDFFDLIPQSLALDGFTGQVARFPPDIIHSIHRHRQIQARIVEREAIHDLVVIVVRRFLLRVGETRRVSTLEVNQSPAVLIEERMLGWIVEVVMVV